jgi:hypothetical protein
MPTIKLDEFLSGLEILESEAQNFNDAMKCYIVNADKADIITYDSISRLSLNNIDMLKINSKGQYYYDFKPDKNCDIINNIRIESPNCQTKKSYVVSGVEYSDAKLDTFVITAAPYSEFLVRITFCEKPTADAKVNILIKCYLLSLDCRNTLMKLNIITKNNIYSNGVCWDKDKINHL